nr:MAG TPA: hypothetical protein [Caudoviricetes sp.]
MGNTALWLVSTIVYANIHIYSIKIKKIYPIFICKSDYNIYLCRKESL